LEWISSKAKEEEEEIQVKFVQLLKVKRTFFNQEQLAFGANATGSY
jgi:hypothetical protein